VGDWEEKKSSLYNNALLQGKKAWFLYTHPYYTSSKVFLQKEKKGKIIFLEK